MSSSDNLDEMSDNIDLTSEQESTLLGVNSEDMAVDTPSKSGPEEPRSQRRSIVYDLDYSNGEEDDDEDSGRDKFRSERTESLATFSLKGQETIRNIPESLGVERTRREFGILGGNNFVARQRTRSRGKNRNKNFKRYSAPYGRSGPTSDLRNFINQTRNSSHSRIPRNLLFSGLGFNSVQNYQMRVGILNPIVAQNQLLMNALISQNPNNPLLNRLQVGGQNLSSGNSYRRPDDIQITIKNSEMASNNANRMPTTSRIRCLVPRDDSMTDSAECEVIASMPSMPQTSDIRQPKDKTPFKTLFAKHLKDKVNQSKVHKQDEEQQNKDGGLFGDVLAEVEVGVDNDYLRRMEEMKKQREELLRRKEESRLAMADERMESAMKLKQRIQMS